MVRLKDQKKSENVQDTINSPYQRLMHALFNRINPVYKSNRYINDLIDSGWTAGGPPDKHIFGAKPNFERMVLEQQFQEIMKNDALVNPHVIYDPSYGDLIDSDKRIEDMINEGQATAEKEYAKRKKK